MPTGDCPPAAEPLPKSGGEGVPSVAAPAPDETGRVRLGTVGGVQVQIAVDSMPWLLRDIDALVISAAPSGLGQLGWPLHDGLPDPAWKQLDLTLLRPDKPQVLRLNERHRDESGSAIRYILLACARETETHALRSVEAPASLDAIRRTTAAVIDRAVSEGVSGLGVPLIGAGAIGLPNSEAAFEIVPVVRAALRALPAGSATLPRLSRLVFVCRDAACSRAIERVWGYYELLHDARRDAFEDEVLRADAERARIPMAELEAALDVPENEIWQGCVTEAARLRRLDKELDDLRTVLVGSLESKLMRRQQEAAPSEGRRRLPYQKRLESSPAGVQLAMVAGISALAASGIWGIWAGTSPAHLRLAGCTVLVCVLVPYALNLLAPFRPRRRPRASAGSSPATGGFLLCSQPGWPLPGPIQLLLVGIATGGPPRPGVV